MLTNRLPQLEHAIARLKRRAAQLEHLSRKYWRARRVIVFTGLVVTLLTLQLSTGSTGLLVAALFVVLFAVVALYHNRVRESIVRNNLMQEIKDLQIKRINLEWEHLPPADQISAGSEHPFATDIDLTGERSLHRLLDTTVTTEGSRRLRSWLLNNVPDPEVISKRQQLVRELRRLSLFRDKLHLFASLVSKDATSEYLGKQQSFHRERWESHTLVSWIEHAAPKQSLLPTIILLAVLAVINLTVFVLSNLDLIPHLWPISFLVYFAAMMFLQGRIGMAWDEVQDLEKALRRFGAVFKYLETRRCHGLPELAGICAPFLDPNKRPSAELGKVGRIAAALGVRTNPILWFLIHLVCPWDFIFAHRLERLKKEIAEQLPRWLDAWYELEALNSLANFAWLNPHYRFPEITLNQKLFAARGLGHPLIKPEHKVSNDFTLGDQNQLVILTGSNMAGKSTFLRTIGLNLRLAYTGAPVNADKLHISLFRLFTCINVSDSVQDGLSYFYAEVKRLKLLLSEVEADHELPIMFLIDEIFRGTNNRERHIGSRAFIHALAQQPNALGLIATHDLELTKSAEEIPGVANFHFREDVSDGRMVFDYLLRTGPCPTTNALKIMRIEGLPVEG